MAEGTCLKVNQFIVDDLFCKKVRIRKVNSQFINYVILWVHIKSKF